MEKILTLKEIADFISGEIIDADPEIKVADIVRDNREVKEGFVFVALKGEKNDGHNYVYSAMENGAVCCIVNKGEKGINVPRIEVEDTFKALRDVAELYRTKFDIPVVAITGSVGKTSTKDMIYSVLAQEFNALKTQQNFNNEIGLPLTVFGMAKEQDIAVLEMGMNHKGEISRLSKIAKPETAIITNISCCHIENLGSMENIMRAKLEILESMVEGGAVILNGDDEMLWSLKGELPFETLYFGIENEKCDILAKNIKKYSDGTDFTAEIEGKEYKFSIAVAGIHHVYNALAGILTGYRYGMSIEKIQKGVGQFIPLGLRQKIIDKNGYTVIKDCYNASPTSMKSGLDVLSATRSDDKIEHRRVAILGDMLELGEFSPEAHRSVGRLVCEYGVDCLITIGENALLIAEEARQGGVKTISFKNNEEAKKEILLLLKTDDIILLKASHGMHLEEIADYITGENGEEE